MLSRRTNPCSALPIPCAHPLDESFPRLSRRKAPYHAKRRGLAYMRCLPTSAPMTWQGPRRRDVPSRLCEPKCGPPLGEKGCHRSSEIDFRCKNNAKINSDILKTSSRDLHMRRKKASVPGWLPNFWIFPASQAGRPTYFRQHHLRQLGSTSVESERAAAACSPPSRHQRLQLWVRKVT